MSMTPREIQTQRMKALGDWLIRNEATKAFTAKDTTSGDCRVEGYFIRGQLVLVNYLPVPGQDVWTVYLPAVLGCVTDLQQLDQAIAERAAVWRSLPRPETSTRRPMPAAPVPELVDEQACHEAPFGDDPPEPESIPTKPAKRQPCLF